MIYVLKIFFILWILLFVLNVIIVIWCIGYLIWGDSYLLLPKKWREDKKCKKK